MSYQYPYIMTKEEIEIVCCLRNQDAIIVQRNLRGKWKEEVVTFLATTRFTLNVRLLDESIRKLKWNEYGDKWKIVKKVWYGEI